MKRLGVKAAIVGGEVIAGDVGVDGDRIVAVGLAPAGLTGLAVPGYLDIQVNGYAGVDFIDADVDGFRVAAEAMLGSGVTAFQPTLITLPDHTYLAALGRAARAQREVIAPRLLGVHLEGPFLSPQRPGAHDPSLILDPDWDFYRRLLDAGPVSYVTLAPERPGALALIEHLVARGVTVAIGHSDADAPTAHRAFNRGARAVTHLFNAQRPFRHRDPGIAFAGLARRDIVVCVINDGVHLAPETMQVVIQAARGRMALVTDAVSAAGLPEGTYPLGAQTVTVKGTEVRLEDGTLAGSVLAMDRAVRNLIELGVPQTEALAAATDVPARLIGRPDLGTLAPGTTADIVVLDSASEVKRTFVGGREVYAQ